MKTRHFRYPYRRRHHGMLWLLLGLCGLSALAAALLGSRRRRERWGDTDAAGARREAAGRAPEEPRRETAPPESLSVWIAGPAGNLFVRDGGPAGSGALPVLFLHSLAGNGGQWALQLDHLRRHRRAVALDFRGHGESDPAEDGDYSVHGLMGDVAAVADQLGLRRFLLAGHSLGAAVATED